MKQKTFAVVLKMADGSVERQQAQQLGTFVEYIENEQFRFVVTHAPGAVHPAVTHRATGMRVVGISHLARAAAMGDVIRAGRSQLAKLIAEKGAKHVHDVLRHAERSGQAKA